MTNSKLDFLDGEPIFFCPGCGFEHIVNIHKPNASHKAMWKFNGNNVLPTFSPSILVFPGDKSRRCHSFVEDGNIRFLTDCFHKLAGKTVELPNANDWWA